MQNVLKFNSLEEANRYTQELKTGHQSNRPKARLYYFGAQRLRTGGVTSRQSVPLRRVSLLIQTDTSISAG